MADAPTTPLPSHADDGDATTRIAELVRRTSERKAARGAAPAGAPESSAPATDPDATVAAPPIRPDAGVTPEATVASPVDPDATMVAPVSPEVVAAAPTAPAAPPGDEANATQQLPALDAALFSGADAPVPQPATSASSTPPARSPGGARRPRWQVLAAAAVVLVLVVWGAVALSQSGGSGTASSTTRAAGKAMPYGYAVQASDTITDCAAHARGRTKAAFEAQNCVNAKRSLATGQLDGRRVLFVVSRVEMPSAEAAVSVRQVLDGNGTGNINDLLREGRTFPGGPARMPSSGYASTQTGKVLVVAEAGYIDGGPSSDNDSGLRTAAAEVAAAVIGS